MKPSEDNLIFDRLVDNELNHEERDQLLGSLDERPDGWRKCALAFLEHQSWSRQIKSIAAPPTSEKVALGRAEQSWTANRRLGILAMAACLLVAFFVGRTISPDVAISITGSENQMVNSNSEHFNGPESVPAQPRLDDRDVVTLLVRDDQGRAKRVRVPLFDLTADNQSSATFVNMLPEDVRQSFKRQGKDLRVRRRYAPLYFEQNEQVVPMAVPVDDAYLVPVGGPVL